MEFILLLVIMILGYVNQYVLNQMLMQICKPITDIVLRIVPNHQIDHSQILLLNFVLLDVLLFRVYLAKYKILRV